MFEFTQRAHVRDQMSGHVLQNIITRFYLLLLWVGMISVILASNEDDKHSIPRLQAAVRFYAIQKWFPQQA